MGVPVVGFVGESGMLDKEREALLSLIPQSGLFIEVGTFHGVTTAYWASQRTSVTFLSIDPFVGKADISLWYKNHQKNQNLFVGTLMELSENNYLCLNRFDAISPIVFIDGDHSERACLSDIIRSLDFNPLEIWVHDYTNPDTPGVTKAVDTFLNKDGEDMALKVVESTAILSWL